MFSKLVSCLGADYESWSSPTACASGRSCSITSLCTPPASRSVGDARRRPLNGRDSEGRRSLESSATASFNAGDRRQVAPHSRVACFGMITDRPSYQSGCSIGFQSLCGAFGDCHYRGVQIGADDVGHDRGVGDPEQGITCASGLWPEPTCLPCGHDFGYGCRMTAALVFISSRSTCPRAVLALGSG